MKHILVNDDRPELFRIMAHIGKEIEDFKIRYEGGWFSRREVLEILFTDGSSIFIKST